MTEIEAAQQQVLFLRSSDLNPRDVQRVRLIDQKLNLAMSYLDRSLDDPQSPRPPKQALEFFQDDQCATELIGRASERTQCEVAFVGAMDSWGISLGGVCYDIVDMPTVKACQIFQGASQRGVKLYRNESCKADLVAVVDSYYDCQKLRGLPDVWAIEANGQCSDITDLPAPQACERFKN